MPVQAPQKRLDVAKIVTENNASGGFEAVNVSLKAVSEINFHELIVFASGKGLLAIN